MNTLMKKTNGNVPATAFSGLVNKLFPNDLNRFFDDTFWGFNGVAGAAQVPVNVRETSTGYRVQVIAPGLKKEEFSIKLNSELLTISFEHREEQNTDNKQQGWLHREYQKRSFTRSFSLGDTIDASRITAEYKDGILNIDLPKKEGAQDAHRVIEVQ